MDFFAAQDRARARTRGLVAYFILGLAGLIAAIYVVAMVAFGLVEHRTQGEAWDARNGRTPEVSLDALRELNWWRPDVFEWVTLGTLVVVGGACLTKIAELRSGGGAVAESLGGAPVNPQTTDPAERRLLNVVEEMALAAGVPVPQAYVLEEEGINAFAAGFRPEDAAVAVTRGALRSLSRDELQGVLGHEFSHILNGDMRLNVQLIGAVFGLVVITVLGRELVYMLRFQGRSRNDKNNVLLGLFFLGLALIVLGWLGVLFGRLIQAAVSRQREKLADASAVQFTRNPEGLAGALKKIGGLGSQVKHAHVEETAHIFFAPAMTSIFATHPPLEERIRELEPNWDGQFITVRPPPEAAPARAANAFVRTPQAVGLEQLLAPAGVAAAVALADVHEWRDNLPGEIAAALESREGCRALALALAFDRDPAGRERQLQRLEEVAEPAASLAAGLADAVVAVPAGRQLPLLELALAGLAQAASPEKNALLARLRELTDFDRRPTLHDFALWRVAERRLSALPPRQGAPMAPQYYRNDVAAVLSALAYSGTDDAAQAQDFFAHGTGALTLLGRVELTLQPREATLGPLQVACARLETAPFPLKKQLLEAGAQVVQADGVVQPEEAELLRALAASLGCPLPLS